MLDIYLKKNGPNTRQLTLANVVEMLGDFGFRDQDIIAMYAHSKITNVEEYSSKSPYPYNKCRLVELLEIIARAAEAFYREKMKQEEDDLDLLGYCELFVQQVLAKHKIFEEAQGADVAESDVSGLFEY